MPVNNDARKMPLISKENAERYYDELLSNYHYKTKLLYTKIPFLKDLIEHHILKEATNIDEFRIHFKGAPLGQWKWLFDRKDENGNYFPRTALISGIEHLFKDRNEAEHEPEHDMDDAGYRGHLRTVAKTIKKLSGVPFPQEIQDILDGRNRKDSPDSGRKSDKKDVHTMAKKREPQIIKDDEEDMKRCRRCNRCNRWHNPKEVLYNGSITSKVMFIAQAPGDFEDRTILVHDPTGKNFQQLLDHIGWQRESIFITNSVLCYSSREKPKEPYMDEIKACSPYLVRMIELVKPEVVVTLGEYAFKAMNKIEPTKVKFGKDILAKEIAWNGRKLFPLYLPTSPYVIPKLRTMDEFKKDFDELKRIV